jgi:hypothetical protein
MAKTIDAPTIVFKLRLPEPLYDKLSLRATKFGRTVEEEIALRLRDTQDYTSIQPIYLTDEDRAALTQIAGKMIRTAADLMTWASQLTTLHVEGVDVPLTQTLVTRLKSRQFGVTWPEHVRRTVTECLEQFCGMR